MGFSVKRNKTVRQPSRKQQRKEKRKEKKLRKSDFFSKKRISGQFVLNPDRTEVSNDPNTFDCEEINSTVEKPNSCAISKTNKPFKNIPSSEDLRKKDFKVQKKLEKDMIKQRSKQLVDANREEDKIIKHLEKQLDLNKRKSKALPKSFVEEGLDYLLEVCDPMRMTHVVGAEKDLDNSIEFEEDFELMTGKPSKKLKNKISAGESKVNVLKKDHLDISEDDEHFSDELSEDDYNDQFESNEDLKDFEGSEDMEGFSEDDEDGFKTSRFQSEESIQECSISENDSKESKGKKRKKQQLKKVEKIKKQKLNEEINEGSSDDAETNCVDEFDSDAISDTNRQNDDGTWEDIYGRRRGKDGSVIQENESSKYVPPAVRNKLSGNSGMESEKILRLKKQLKGLLNRLAESNMHSIASQIEELYMNNSRNDMNDTLTTLIMESLISPILTPERLLVEHIVLMSILHANVGTEVGAHFLQTVICKLNECIESHRDVENKNMDNIVMVIAQLYNFKIFDSKLMYEILTKLGETFDEKGIECILHILRNVGFSLRKDDPIALKNLIVELQKKATNISDANSGYTRVKFLLDILLAIKNNNVTKIPNYDVSYSEHLKKAMKGLIRKGNYITQLNISLDDLLKAEERGRWWVVGSAWSGQEKSDINNAQTAKQSEQYSGKLLALAKKQRMNTETRRNIFCIIMSAEDYLDAFERLLKLHLRNQQEREIVNVILHCCLQEKQYNPYYSHLMQKFCDYDRKYQITIKYSVWDKLKALNEHSGCQISNLAKMLIHLFIDKGIPISALKIVHFSELDKVTQRFMRQVLIGIILHEDVESCLAVFAKVSISDKLKMFRESLRLFIHHFLLKNLKTDIIADEHKNLLKERAKMVEKLLASKELRL